MSENMVNVSISNFEQIISSDKPAVLFFWSESENFQKDFESMNSLSSKYSKYALFGLINAGENKELCSHFGITTLPGVAIIKDGRLLFNACGEDSVQGCKKAIEELIYDKGSKSSFLKKLLKTI